VTVEADPSLLRSSSVMATGTVVSRITGVLRTSAISAAIGTLLLADAYSTANTLPNIVYILLIGGALNAVFIPQLVRHMKDDDDGGNAYADRLLTLSGLALLLITVLAVLAAPFLTKLYAGPQWSARQLQVATSFAYLCLPQILFYGLYALYSQVLNARGRFAAPMFAPIVNNVVVIGGCLAFIVSVRSTGLDTISRGQIAFLGILTTLGVVAQAMILLPPMARAGYRFRPRFDLRGQGLGVAVGLAKWTLFFVAVNQVAYVIIIRLANSAGAVSAAAGREGAGSYIYSTAHLMFVLPNSIVTVSIVTALLPRMSRAVQDGRIGDVRGDVSRGIRLVSTAMVPATVAMLLLGPRLGQLLVSYGQTSNSTGRLVGQVLQAFTVGVIGYAIYYVLLRGFYSLEDTKTPALVNIFLNLVNVGVGYALYQVLPPEQAVSGLALGYAVAYTATAVVLWALLRRRLDGLDTYLTVRTLVRLILAGVVCAGPAVLVELWISGRVGEGKVGALITCIVVTPVVVGVFLLVARRIRIAEVNQLLAMVAAKLGR